MSEQSVEWYEERLAETETERDALRERAERLAVLAGERTKAIVLAEEQVAELEIDCAAVRRLLFAAAEILDSATHQVDLIWPNDAEPEMQEHLHEIAERLRALSDSEIGCIRGPESKIAEAATEERLKKEKAQGRIKVLEEALRGYMEESPQCDCLHCERARAALGEV